MLYSSTISEGMQMQTSYPASTIESRILNPSAPLLCTYLQWPSHLASDGLMMLPMLSFENMHSLRALWQACAFCAQNNILQYITCTWL
jgi:hypothetical protein